MGFVMSTRVGSVRVERANRRPRQPDTHADKASVEVTLPPKTSPV